MTAAPPALAAPSSYGCGMEVFLLYHVAHAGSADGSARHRDAAGELLIDEQVGDEVFLLGCYSTQDRAEQRIDRARALPGFRDEPRCFMISRYEVDHDEWTEGFATIRS